MKQILILKEPMGQISKPELLFKKIKRIKIDYRQEHFLVFCLNTKNQVIKSEIVAKGIINACMISPTIIFRNAILKNANKIIIAHNHPSNDLTPSPEDKEIFGKLKECGELLDIKVLDSIIFHKKEFFSMSE